MTMLQTRHWQTISDKPHRLFFLSASSFVVMLLGFCLGNLLWAKVPNDSLLAFYFVQTLSAATLAGFLMTALPLWQGRDQTINKAQHGKRLWGLWLMAMVVATVSLTGALLLMTLFFAYIAWHINRQAWQDNVNHGIHEHGIAFRRCAWWCIIVRAIINTINNWLCWHFRDY